MKEKIKTTLIILLIIMLTGTFVYFGYHQGEKTDLMGKLKMFWLLIGIMFFLLAIMHFLLAFKKVSFLKIPDRFEKTWLDIRVAGKELDWPVKDLTNQLNKFLDNFNKSNMMTNIVTALGYLIASMVAFLSSFLLTI